MVRIVYEYPIEWPEEGPMRLDARISGEITVPPELARRRANGYFARNVAMFIIADEPLLNLGEHPVWRIPAVLRLRNLGKVATVGSLDIDARTGDVIPLSETEIIAIRNRANDIALRLTPTTTTSS